MTNIIFILTIFLVIFISYDKNTCQVFLKKQYGKFTILFCLFGFRLHQFQQLLHRDILCDAIALHLPQALGQALDERVGPWLGGDGGIDAHLGKNRLTEFRAVAIGIGLSLIHIFVL